MKYLSLILGAALLIAGCSDSPSSPGGTLPVVQNCRIDTENCKGDTITVAWDPVNVEVDGYRLWFATTDPGDWQNIAQVEGTSFEHIATSTGYYCVEAMEGIDLSEDLSNKANDRADMHLLTDTLVVGGTDGLSFSETHTAFGSSSDPSFAQDVFIGKEGDTILFYRGNYDPENHPGGTQSYLAPSSNYVAPGPGDTAWKSSVAPQDGSTFFVELESGYYAHFFVDTVYADTVVVGSNQFQSIQSVRLFNPFIY